MAAKEMRVEQNCVEISFGADVAQLRLHSKD